MGISLMLYRYAISHTRFRCRDLDGYSIVQFCDCNGWLWKTCGVMLLPMHRTLRADGSGLCARRGGTELKSNCGWRNAWNGRFLFPALLLKPLWWQWSRLDDRSAFAAPFIGCDPLWDKAIALHQRHQQALGRAFITPLSKSGHRRKIPVLSGPIYWEALLLRVN
ncbi:hypothetical protein GOZ92_11205 [Agrobacterium vitis]|nr:hypothetical protein [Agrobacterium vitis]MVA25001.1 hypothetical protein [Agrobacterium vitis]